MKEYLKLGKKLFPLHRSITGKGVVETLSLIKKKIPNLFIVGSPRCGTTSLFNNLKQHKDIFIPRIKEPRFFDSHVFYDYKKDYPIKSVKKYLELFKTDKLDKKYFLDCSIFALYSKKSINNILKISPEAKFIVIMRDPVDASISMHKQRLGYTDLKMRELSEDFIKCWRMIKFRKKKMLYPVNCRNKILFRYDLLYSYERYIPYLISKIKKKNLFIIFYDDYFTFNELFYNKLFKFLKIRNIKINNHFINTSYPIKNSSFIYYFIKYFVTKSSDLIKKIGFRSDKLLFMYNFFLGFYKLNYKKSDDLSEVKNFFKKTYNYLNLLKKKYPLNLYK